MKHLISNTECRTFIYAIEATCNYGKSVTKTGTVILIR